MKTFLPHAHTTDVLTLNEEQSSAKREEVEAPNAGSLTSVGCKEDPNKLMEAITLFTKRADKCVATYKQVANVGIFYVKIVTPERNFQVWRRSFPDTHSAFSCDVYPHQFIPS